MIEEQIIFCKEGEAIVDICLAIASVNNVCQRWTPLLYVEIGFHFSNYSEQPSPYQILQNTSSSSITLHTYRTSQMILHPKQEKTVDNICTFRAHVPILCLEEGKLACQIKIIAQNQQIGRQVVNYDTLMNLKAFLPAYDMGLGLSIEAMIETQLIGFRFRHKQQYSRVTLYKMIDTLVLEHNRLASKLKDLNKNLTHSKIEPQLKILNFESSQLPDVSEISYIDQLEQDKVFEEQFQNPFQIENLSTFPQLSEIRKKTMQKIFTNGSLEKNREELRQFGLKFIPRTSATLQLSWGNYLRKIKEKKFIQENVKNLRMRFFSELHYEIKQRVLKNQDLQILYNQQESMLRQIGELDQLYLKNKIIVSNSVIIDLDGIEVSHYIPPKMLVGEESVLEKRSQNQCVVLVHGYGANSVSMMMLERILSYIYPHVDILNSKSNEVPNELMRIEDMGRGLATEIQLYLERKQKPEDVEISFICHSLGGLIARAALVYLERYKFNMNLFVSLSSPHLGHLYHSNRLTKLGMMAISSLKNLKVIDCLLLKDGGDGYNLRHSSIYGLSMHKGLSWFKTVHLYGSSNDGYVSMMSALIEGKKQMKGEKGEVMKQMLRNLEESLGEVETKVKFNVKFTEQAIPDPSLSQYLLGRTSHLSFLNFPRFVNCVAMNCYKSLKKAEEY